MWGGRQSVKCQLDLRIVVCRYSRPLFQSNVAVCGRQSKVVKVAFQLGHEVVSVAGRAFGVAGAVGVNALVALERHHSPERVRLDQQ